MSDQWWVETAALNAWSAHPRLSVGTKKGLLVVDTHSNKLVEVIGSDKKLLGELCLKQLQIYMCCMCTCMCYIVLIKNKIHDFMLHPAELSGQIDKPLLTSSR